MPIQLQSAPDFELTDITGKLVRLFAFRGQKNVVLILLRGFM